MIIGLIVTAESIAGYAIQLPGTYCRRVHRTCHKTVFSCLIKKPGVDQCDAIPNLSDSLIS